MEEEDGAHEVGHDGPEQRERSPSGVVVHQIGEGEEVRDKVGGRHPDVEEAKTAHSSHSKALNSNLVHTYHELCHLFYVTKEQFCTLQVLFHLYGVS